MVATWSLVSLAAAGAAALTLRQDANEQDMPNVNTATSASAVYKAQATAATYEGSTSPYKTGKVFDRYVEIWLENTDYDKAAGDPNLAFLASKGITLSNYFGVTHPYVD